MSDLAEEGGHMDGLVKECELRLTPEHAEKKKLNNDKKLFRAEHLPSGDSLSQRLNRGG